MSVAMLCIELENKRALKTGEPLGDAYQLGGSFTIPAKACAQ